MTSRHWRTGNAEFLRGSTPPRHFPGYVDVSPRNTTIETDKDATMVRLTSVAVYRLSLAPASGGADQGARVSGRPTGRETRSANKRRTMKMVARIGLVLALACIAAPATLRGSTWYFIKLNPAADTASIGDTAIWCGEVMEVDGDSTPTPPDSFDAVSAYGLETLGFMPTAGAGNYAVDSEYAPNRIWKSWLIWGSGYDNHGNKCKIMWGSAGTYRPGGLFHEGYVAVEDSVHGDTIRRVNDWISSPFNSAIVLTNRFNYPIQAYWRWDVWGTHSWGSDWKYSHIWHSY